MYAQILKNFDYIVNLVGGEEVGLPIEHPDVICIDIGDRTDIIPNMTYYDTVKEEFYAKGQNIILTPTELRKQAYSNMVYKEDGTTPLILWEDKTITVDEANQIYIDYFVENNPKADTIQTLIISAKEYIRELYPDA